MSRLTEVVLYDNPIKYTQKQIDYLSQFSESVLLQDGSWTRGESRETDVLSVDTGSLTDHFDVASDVVQHVKQSIINYGAEIFDKLDVIGDIVDIPKNKVKQITLGLMLLSAGIFRSDRHSINTDQISTSTEHVLHGNQTIEDAYNLYEKYPDTYAPTLSDVADIEPNSESNSIELELDIFPSSPSSAVDALYIDDMIHTYAQIPKMKIKRLEKAVRHLDQAISRLQSNPVFASQGHTSEDLMQSMLPLMIKESSLRSSVVQKDSKAKGYCQLLPGARADAADYIRNTLGVSKSYNVMDPVDNIILGTVYFNCCLPRYFSKGDNNKTFEKVFADRDVQKFVQVAYNAGAGTMRILSRMYLKETGDTGKIERDKFAPWLINKTQVVDGTGDQVYSTTHGLMYNNRFGSYDTRKSLSKNKNDLIPDVITYSKLVEIVDYAEVIGALGRGEFVTDPNKR